jgi:hypothetical protein
MALLVLMFLGAIGAAHSPLPEITPNVERVTMRDMQHWLDREPLMRCSLYMSRRVADDFKLANQPKIPMQFPPGSLRVRPRLGFWTDPDYRFLEKTEVFSSKASIAASLYYDESSKIAVFSVGVDDAQESGFFRAVGQPPRRVPRVSLPVLAQFSRRQKNIDFLVDPTKGLPTMAEVRRRYGHPGWMLHRCGLTELVYSQPRQTEAEQSTHAPWFDLSFVFNNTGQLEALLVTVVYA